MIGQLLRVKHKINSGGEPLEKPKSKKFQWILIFVVAGIIIATQVKRGNPDLDIPGDEELFQQLPEKAKKAFREKYGRPNDDDRECELYYLLAKSTMKRPCAKCPVWCMDSGKIHILVSKVKFTTLARLVEAEAKERRSINKQ